MHRISLTNENALDKMNILVVGRTYEEIWKIMEEKYIAAIGVSCIDEYYSMEQWIPEGEKANIRFKETRVGGMIPNAACVMAGQGKKTYLITALNSGPVSQRIKADLQKWNLDLSKCITDDSLSDPKCFILSSPGERTILVSDTSEIRYPVDASLHSFLMGAECIYTSMMEFHRLENCEKLAGELAEHGVKLVFDMETSTFDDREDFLFSYASLLFFNEEGWKKFKGSRDDEAAMAILFAGRVETVVITLGAEGCYCRNREEEIRLPGNKVEVVDTTGAGDTFNCTFTALWLAGEPLNYTAEMANAAGAHAVTVMGARGGIAKQEEIEKWAEGFREKRSVEEK